MTTRHTERENNKGRRERKKIWGNGFHKKKKHKSYQEGRTPAGKEGQS